MTHILVIQHSDLCRTGRLGRLLIEQGRVLDIRHVGRDGSDALPGYLGEYDGVLSLGGPQNIDEGHEWMRPEMDLLRRAHEDGLAVVGICLGHQLLATTLGGRVDAMETPEVGFHEIRLSKEGRDDPVLAGHQWESLQFCSHGQEVVEVPDGSDVLASSDGCEVQALRHGPRTYGFQYHFEWTRDIINDVSEAGHTLLHRCHLTMDDIDAQCDAHYDRFDEVNMRLCDHLAGLLYPVHA